MIYTSTIPFHGAADPWGYVADMRLNREAAEKLAQLIEDAPNPGELKATATVLRRILANV